MAITAILGVDDLVFLGQIVQTQTRPSWTITVVQSNNSPLDITGATFTGVLQNLRRSERISCTVGSYSITTAASGIFTYAPVAADVASLGLWGWQTIMTISGQLYIIRFRIDILPNWAD